MALVHLSEKDAEVQTAVSKGDTVELRLRETPTTGYRWRWRLPESLALVADEHVTAEPGRPGQGGQRRLAFDVRDVGTHELRAELARPWEEAAATALTFVIDAS